MRFIPASERPHLVEDKLLHPEWFYPDPSVSKACRSAIAALVRKDEKADVHVNNAARLVAAAATTHHMAKLKKGERIEAYLGQRGITFGILRYDRVRQRKRYFLTKECNAVRMWFRRNVFDNKNTPKLKKGVWARIAKGVAALGKIGRKLKVEEAEKFETRINALLKSYTVDDRAVK